MSRHLMAKMRAGAPRVAAASEPSDLVCGKAGCGAVKPGGEDHDGDYSCPSCGSGMDYDFKPHSTRRLADEYGYVGSGDDYGMALLEELHDREEKGDKAARKALADQSDEDYDEDDYYDEDDPEEDAPCTDCGGSGLRFLDDDAVEAAGRGEDPEDTARDLAPHYLREDGGLNFTRPCPTCDGHGDLNKAWNPEDEGRGSKWIKWQNGEGHHPDCGSDHVPVPGRPEPVPGRPHTRDAVGGGGHPAYEDFTRLPTGSSADYYDWMHEHTPFYDWPQFSHESVESFMEDAPGYMTESCADDAIHDWIDEQEAAGWPSWRGEGARYRHEVPPEADPRRNRNLLSRIAQMSWEDAMRYIDETLAAGEPEPEQAPSTVHPAPPGWTHVADPDGNNWFHEHPSGLRAHVEDADPGGRATWSVYESPTEPPVAHGDEEGMTPGSAMRQAMDWIESNHHLVDTEDWEHF